MPRIAVFIICQMAPVYIINKCTCLVVQTRLLRLSMCRGMLSYYLFITEFRTDSQVTI